MRSIRPDTEGGGKTAERGEGEKKGKKGGFHVFSTSLS